MVWLDLATAAQAARGVHGSTYNKALASLKRFTLEQIAEMEEAAGFLQQSQGAILSYQSLQSCTCLLARIRSWVATCCSDVLEAALSKSVSFHISVESRQVPLSHDV